MVKRHLPHAALGILAGQGFGMPTERL